MGQKLPKQTGEEIAKVLEKGHLPHYTPPLLKFFLLMSPVVYAGYWEYNRYVKRYVEFEKIKKRFDGDTPFYGKAWGYSTDYLVENSLMDGDLIFFGYDPDSLHIHQSILKSITCKISNSLFDDVGIIMHINGVCHIVIFNPLDKNGGITIEKYSDKLASSFPLIVGIRRLYCSDEIRKRIASRIQENIKEFYNLHSSRWKRIWINIWRRHFLKLNNGGLLECDDYFYERMEKNWSELSLQLRIIKLKCLIADIEEYCDVIEKNQDKYSEEDAHKINYYNNSIKEICQSISRIETEINEFGGNCEIKNEGVRKNSPKTVSLLDFTKFFNRFADSCNFIVEVYKSLGLLPSCSEFKINLFDIQDLLSVDYLMPVTDIIVTESSLFSDLVPRLSKMFYVRQDIVEKEQSEKAYSKKIPK